jgi:hypothetical protein
MSLTFYVGDYGPVPAAVTEEDGITPATPLSASADIVNLHTGATVIAGATCLVETGTAAYIIPSGSPITATPARYTAFITVDIDATTRQSVAVPFDVLDKSSSLIVDRWRRRVEFAAPNQDAVSDQEGRDWIDQAVGVLNRYRSTDYTSVLASITPTPSAGDADLIASVASLLARASWWAGKGNWRDEEMSFDGTPFEREWARLEPRLEISSLEGWFGGDFSHTTDMYNRDKTDRFGIPDDPDDYFDQEWLRDNQAEI